MRLIQSFSFLRNSGPILPLCGLLLLTACSTPKTTSAGFTQGETALNRGDYLQAVALYTQAITKDETNPLLYAERGSAYNGLHRFKQALADFDTALGKIKDQKDPRLVYIYYHRGYAYELEGFKKEGLENYLKAVALNPAFPDAHGNAAWILATHPDSNLRNPKKALEYALIEAKISKMADTAVLDTLAAAYAANGRFDEAVVTQKKALASATDHEDKFNFAERLKLYEQKKSYVEPTKANATVQK
ncbi:MAG: yrrB 1 [Verrucomicrobiales bacterium]|nr:yrrB 1 [Verrucomicrobiales bacterium]